MKRAAIPEVLPVSPGSLPCPRCKAKPGKDCEALVGGFYAVHIERVAAAAAMDIAKKRKPRTPAAARIVREATEK